MARASVKATLLAPLLLVIACSQLAPEHKDTYQQLLATLCGAPPQVMQSILTTDELRTAWLFICTHAPSVPNTPVVAAGG